jgi:REP element-mobilizing transposase RayT
MDEYESLNHTKWECKYHVVFIPKYRRKELYGQLRRDLGPVFRTLTEQRESRVEEGHVMPDHVHMILSIPPKYSVSQVVGYIKGKSAIHIARTTWAYAGTSSARTSGREGTSSPRSAETSRPSASTSATRKRRTSGSTR